MNIIYKTKVTCVLSTCSFKYIYRGLEVQNFFTVDKTTETPYQTVIMSNKKSDIWLHFTKSDTHATCKYCHVIVKSSGNTTNLRNHVLRKHPNINTVSLKTKKSETSGGKFKHVSSKLLTSNNLYLPLNYLQFY